MILYPKEVSFASLLKAAKPQVHKLQLNKDDVLVRKTYLYRRFGVMKSSKILSQNWFPGRLSIDMQAKYPQRTEVGIILITEMVHIDKPTRRDCIRLLTLCSLTLTGKQASMCFSGSNCPFASPPSSVCNTASFRSSNSFG